jgi:hypothetical protein
LEVLSANGVDGAYLANHAEVKSGDVGAVNKTMCPNCVEFKAAEAFATGVEQSWVDPGGTYRGGARPEGVWLFKPDGNAYFVPMSVPASSALARLGGQGLRLAGNVIAVYAAYKDAENIYQNGVKADIRDGTEGAQTARLVGTTSAGWAGGLAAAKVGGVVGLSCGPWAWLCSPFLGGLFFMGGYQGASELANDVIDAGTGVHRPITCVPYFRPYHVDAAIVGSDASRWTEQQNAIASERTKGIYYCNGELIRIPTK